MKQLLRLLLIAPLLLSVGCDPIDSNNVNDEPTPSLTLKDLSGVWVDPSNELYYISIYPSGRYTYCLNDMLIGSGTCVYEDGELTLNNNYTYTSDIIKVSLSNDKLSINGEISDGELQKINVNKRFDLSDEELSKSVVGSHISASGGVPKNYEKIKKEITFISDVNFTYESTGKLKTTGEWKTLSSIMWYYVYRTPYTYGLRIGGDNEVEIYKFGFTEEPGYRLSFNLEDYRVN